MLKKNKNKMFPDASGDLSVFQVRQKTRESISKMILEALEGAQVEEIIEVDDPNVAPLDDTAPEETDSPGRMWERFQCDERVTYPLDYLTPKVQKLVIDKLGAKEGGVVHIEIGYRCGKMMWKETVKANCQRTRVVASRNSSIRHLPLNLLRYS